MKTNEVRGVINLGNLDKFLGNFKARKGNDTRASLHKRVKFDEVQGICQ